MESLRRWNFEKHGPVEGKLWHIQIGRRRRGAYKDRWANITNAAQAQMLYRGLNVCNGYKKRLIVNTHFGETYVVYQESSC